MVAHDLDRFLAEKSSGVLQLGGARMALLDIQSGFWGIRRQMEALVGSKLSNAVLQQAGANGGASFAKSFISTLGQSGPADFSACLRVYQSAGFGNFEIIGLDWPIGRISIRADQTFEAWMMTQNKQSRKTPCCAYTAGVLVGFINVIGARSDVICIEHSCQGMGDEFCQFDLIPADEAKDQAVVSFSPDPGLGRQINLLEMLFERMPMGVAVLDRDYRVQRYNSTWEDFAARYAPPSAAPLVPGVCYFDHLPGSERTILPLFERVLDGETIRENAVRLESKGVVTYWDVVLAPLFEDSEIAGILSVSVDATERTAIQQNLERRVEERTRETERRRQVAEGLRDILSVLNDNRSLEETLDYIVAQAVRLHGAQSGIIYQINNDLQMQFIQASYQIPAQLSALEQIPLYRGGAVQRMFARQPDAVTDIQAHIEKSADRQVFLKPPLSTWLETIAENYRAYLSLPLIIEDEIYGRMALYYKELQSFTDEDIELGMALANQTVLAIQNTRLQQAEKSRRQELKMLLDVAETANSSLNQGEMLSKTLDLIVTLVNASRAGVLLIDEKTGDLIPAVLRPERAVNQEDLARLIQACEIVISSGEVYYIGPQSQQGLTEPGALIPLRSREQILGVLAIIGVEGEEFTERQITVFKSIADQVSVAVENARLFSKIEAAARSTERNRLARDLHDAVTQTLFSASLVAEVLPKIWKKNPEEGLRRIEEIRQLTRGALSEMRTLLLELRPAALVDTDLDDLIGHLVNAFIARTRVEVAYTKETDGNPPPAVKEVFYRVAQEAFNNIAKHAEAAKVVVGLNCQSEQVTLVIEDNGIGFNPEHVPPEHLGLGIMSERAHGIGARLTIDSQRDQGTRVQIIWTLDEEE